MDRRRHEVGCRSERIEGTMMKARMMVVVIDKHGGEQWLTVMREKREKVCCWSEREK